jgi:hypothetical protein
MTVNLPVARPTHLHRPLALLATLTRLRAVVLLPAVALDDRPRLLQRRLQADSAKHSQCSDGAGGRRR